MIRANCSLSFFSISARTSAKTVGREPRVVGPVVATSRVEGPVAADWVEVAWVDAGTVVGWVAG